MHDCVLGYGMDAIVHLAIHTHIGIHTHTQKRVILKTDIFPFVVVVVVGEE